jgi:hypothetical protein
MSGAADLDLRYPIGMLFMLLGAILAVFGIATRADALMYAPSGGVNINLVWGVVMVLFGILMSGLAAFARGRG